MSIRAERGEHSALCDGVVSTLEEGEGVEEGVGTLLLFKRPKRFLKTPRRFDQNVGAF